jgi:putative ABC transport system ATP-binding protein
VAGGETGLRAEAARLLEALGLGGDLLARGVTALSVGQQQRVAAARALLGAPELLVADEPTSSLDADMKQAFIELIFRECARTRTTVVFVSHDSALGGQFDRTVRMCGINRAA